MKFHGSAFQTEVCWMPSGRDVFVSVWAWLGAYSESSPIPWSLNVHHTRPPQLRRISSEICLNHNSTAHWTVHILEGADPSEQEHLLCRTCRASLTVLCPHSPAPCPASHGCWSVEDRIKCEGKEWLLLWLYSLTCVTTSIWLCKSDKRSMALRFSFIASLLYQCLPSSFMWKLGAWKIVTVAHQLIPSYSLGKFLSSVFTPKLLVSKMHLKSTYLWQILSIKCHWC